MIHWSRMALAAVLALMPGGIVFLIAWAFARAYSARLREAREAVPQRFARSHVRALASIRTRDILRAAREVSGMTASPAAGR